MTGVLSPPMFFQFVRPNGVAAGYKLFTYIAGTTTKQATYTDSTMGTPMSNPIVLDANGAATFWLDPTKVYKYVLAPPNDTDPPTSAVYTVDSIAGPINAVILTAEFIGAITNPRTTRETSASVTPTYFRYPEGNVLRYGADSSGTNDSSTAFQSAINVMGGNLQGGIVLVPSGIYRLNTGLTMIARGVILRGESPRESRLYWYGNGIVISIATDAQEIYLENFSLANMSGLTGQTGIQAANGEVWMRNLWIERRVGGATGTAGFHRGIYTPWPGSTGQNNQYLSDSFIEGCSIGWDLDGGNQFAIARCQFEFNDTHVLVGNTGPVNNLSIESAEFLSRHENGTSALCIDIIECWAVQLDRCYCELAFDSNGADTGHRFVFLAGTAAKFVRDVRIAGCYVNGQGIANYGIEFGGSDANNIGTVIKDNTYTRMNTAFIKDGGTKGYVGTNVTITGASAVHSSANPATYYDFDIGRVGSASLTFTPGISFGGGTTGITYTTQVGRFERIGNLIYFTGAIVLSSKGSSTGAARITGLPFTTENTTNASAGVAISMAGLTGTTGGFQGQTRVNDTTINLYYTGTGTPTAMADTNFTNTTEVYFSGIYRVV